MRERTSWRVNPFLHFREDDIYNPLSDSSIKKDDSNFRILQNYRKMEFSLDGLSFRVKSELIDGDWIVPSDMDVSSRFYLKYASIETHTVCNQACRYCPVSLSPRESHFMPKEMFDRIIRDLTDYRETLKGVFLNNYNEPTLDKRIIDQVQTIKKAGLHPAILTNGTELTPEKIDAFVDLGGLSYMAVNISSLQRDEYIAYHGKDNLEKVLFNLEYAKSRDVAERMAIVVLGDGSERHHRNFDAISKKYRDTRFEVRLFEFVDRAGFLNEGKKPENVHKELCGCEEFGSRPLQHIHITSYGKCLFCCQDYEEIYVVGDLNRSSIGEVLAGEKLSSLRAQAYGLREAPGDFICRKCVFALTC